MYLSSQGRTCYITWKCNGNASQYTKSIQRLGGGGSFREHIAAIIILWIETRMFQKKARKTTDLLCDSTF